MKGILKDLYNIDVLTFIKISDKVYKIKTIDKEYALKYVEQRNIDFIMEKLSIINIQFFVYPLRNINNQYIAMNNNNSNNPFENSKTNMITMNIGERSHSTIHPINHNNSNSRNRLFAINILNSSFTGGNNNNSPNNNNGYTPIQIKRSFWNFLLKKRF